MTEKEKIWVQIDFNVIAVRVECECNPVAICDLILLSSAIIEKLRDELERGNPKVTSNLLGMLKKEK